MLVDQLRHRVLQLAARLARGRLGAPALDQPPPQIGGQRLGVAVGRIHASFNPRRNAARPRRRQKLRRSRLFHFKPSQPTYPAHAVSPSACSIRVTRSQSPQPASPGLGRRWKGSRNAPPSSATSTRTPTVAKLGTQRDPPIIDSRPAFSASTISSLTSNRRSKNVVSPSALRRGLQVLAGPPGATRLQRQIDSDLLRSWCLQCPTYPSAARLSAQPGHLTGRITRPRRTGRRSPRGWLASFIPRIPEAHGLQDQHLPRKTATDCHLRGRRIGLVHGRSGRACSRAGDLRAVPAAPRISLDAPSSTQPACASC